MSNPDKLLSMSREQIEDYVDNGQECAQDLIDLYDEVKRLQKIIAKILKDRTVTHEPNTHL